MRNTLTAKRMQHAVAHAQMPAFIAKDGKLTSDIAQAKTLPNGAPGGNPAREVWVTQTALATALNTSYMAEQISLFGVAVGVALLLIGVVLGWLAIAGVRIGRATDTRRETVASRTWFKHAHAQRPGACRATRNSCSRTPLRLV